MFKYKVLQSKGMPDIIYVNSYTVKGSYNLALDRIEINSHYPEALKGLILKHEMKHREIHLKYGYKALPLQILLDYKTVVKLFGDPKTFKIWNSYKEPIKQTRKEKSIDTIFELIYFFAMMGNVFLMIGASIIRIMREQYAKLHKKR